MSVERPKSPLPHQVYKDSIEEEGTAFNIYNFSPHAVEKREKMKARREEMIDLENSEIIPRLLKMNEASEISNNLPLLLHKSMSEG